MNEGSILKLLKRTDKWYLGGGNRLLWAPPFPVFLDRPGFWDAADYYNFKTGPLFTWAILDESGREIKLSSKGRAWTPASLHQTYKVAERKSGLTVSERKCVLPNNVAVSELTITNRTRKGRRLTLVAWSAVESSGGGGMVDGRLGPGAFSFARIISKADFPDFRFGCSFGMRGAKVRSAYRLSEGAVPAPNWELCPFSEAFSPKSAGTLLPEGISAAGVHFVAFHKFITLKPGATGSGVAAWAAGASILESESNLTLILKQRDSLKLSVLNWADHFHSVPEFHADDEFFEMAYWYRWYGLKLNTILGGEERYSYPFVAEGIDAFRAPISYSAPCHMMENRWMHDPDLARGSLLTFIDNQREDGAFRGYIDINHYRQEMFYHANWGRGLLRLDALHPSGEFLKSSYDGLKKLAAYYDSERDREVSGLYDIDNHQETGQEYSSRYTAVSEQADRIDWGEVFRLKGVDVTVYVYELKCALAKIAEKLGLVQEAELWTIEAGKIRDAVRDLMWDPASGMFYDVNPETGSRTRVKSAVCFYPYFTDIAERKHLAGFKKHLFSPKEFWTPVPVPSLSADDPNFSATPEWKSKRMLCPWNGRVWPMSNSHVADALGSAAVRFADPLLRKRTAEFMGKFIRMLFFEGDARRPNSFEHYNPDNGAPSAYRGIDDYQHSWIVDLIIQYVCGIRVEEFSVTVDPFPFGFGRVELSNLQVRGRRLDFTMRGKRFWLKVDGKSGLAGRLGKSLSIQI